MFGEPLLLFSKIPKLLEKRNLCSKVYFEVKFGNQWAIA